MPLQRMMTSLGDDARGLRRISSTEHFLASLQRRRCRGKVSPTLQGAAKLAASHHLLTGVAAFFEIHAVYRFEVQHLRHKGFEGGGLHIGHATEHLGQQPIVKV